MEQNNMAFVAGEWLEPLGKVDPEIRNEVILAVVEYQLTGAEPKLSCEIARVAFAYIRPNVDRMAAFRRKQSERRSKRTTGTEPEITETNRNAPEPYQYSNSNSNSKSESKSKSKTKTKGESNARAGAALPPLDFVLNDFIEPRTVRPLPSADRRTLRPATPRPCDTQRLRSPAG
ncbi:MAG: hypothetical protein K2K69_09415 [Muribaculaceae bacterium]|nr:hypothetical protein [Muribaculaceae bacterium]